MVANITKWKLKIVSLYRTNYLATFHVREMAKLLKTSHVTLLPHINGLEKDTIVKAKKVGKNKVFSFNLNNITAREYIVLAEKSETIEFFGLVFLIKKLMEDISRLNLDGCFIIFGSYAKGNYTKESDIDVFYLGEITKEQIKTIKHFGKIYAKNVSVKTSKLANFEAGLMARNPLIKEVLDSHYIIQNADLFVNVLWRYFNEIKQP